MKKVIVILAIAIAATSKKTKGEGAPKKASLETLKTLEGKVSSKEPKTAAADKATKAAVVKKVTANREVMYLYPADCVDLNQRKIFRAKTRKKLAKLENQLKLAGKGKGDLKVVDVEKELKTFKKEFYAAAKTKE